MPEKRWRGAPGGLWALRGLLRRQFVAADTMGKTASVEGSSNGGSSHVRAPARSGTLGCWRFLSKTGKGEVRGVRKSTGMRMGMVSRRGERSPCRNRARTVAAKRSSGELLQRPGGTKERGK